MSALPPKADIAGCYSDVRLRNDRHRRKANRTGTGLPLIKRIRQEHLDRIALIGAVAASIRVEIAAHFERIELRVGDVDRPAMDAPALPPAKCLHP